LDSSGQQLINLRRPFGSPLPRTGNPKAIERTRQTKESTIADIFPGPATGVLVVVVHVPVCKGEEIEYFLNAIIDPAPLADLSLQQKLPAGWITTIIDRNDSIVAGIPDPEQFFGKPSPPALAAQAK
jgi:hypothetical protein